MGESNRQRPEPRRAQPGQVAREIENIQRHCKSDGGPMGERTMSMRKIIWRDPLPPRDFVPLSSGRGLLVLVFQALAAGAVIIWSGLALLELMP